MTKFAPRPCVTSKNISSRPKPRPAPTTPDDTALKILQKLAKQGEESANTYTQAGRNDLADEELAQVAVVKEYLPQPLSEAEIEAKVKEIIAQTGAVDMKSMGQVMGMATKLMAGQADGKAISAIVRKLLS